MTQQNTQFKIGDRVRFKPEYEGYARSHNIPLEFVVGTIEHKREYALFSPNKDTTFSYGYRLELVPNSNRQEYTQQKENTMKNTQTKQKLGKTQLKQDYVWALVDKEFGWITVTYYSRSLARSNKGEYETIKKVKLEVIGRG